MSNGETRTFSALIRIQKDKSKYGLHDLEVAITRAWGITDVTYEKGNQIKLATPYVKFSARFSIDCTATIQIEMECCLDAAVRVFNAIDQSLHREDTIRSRMCVYVRGDLEAIPIWNELKYDTSKTPGVCSETVEGTCRVCES
jgi:hypothetical protein